MPRAVEEDFGVNHPVGRRTFEVGQHQLAKIGPGDEHRGAGVIHVEKGLQAVKGVRRLQRRLVGIGQAHPVAPRQRKRQLRLEGAFDVHMQLGLGHAKGEIERIGGNADGHGRALHWDWIAAF